MVLRGGVVVSVRDGVLAILTLGPAYGLQLHAELAERAPHRKPVNVGQIYGTLERLTKQDLVAVASTTDDGLPLYSLTPEGKSSARDWMHVPATDALPEWTDMLDQVLITSSLDAVAATALARDFRRWWDGDLGTTRLSLREVSLRHDQRLALVAREALAVAALAWVGAVTAALANNDSLRGYSVTRPKRGRRPKE
jgi:DNA-binding PadR family transcriptional regulator